MVYLDAEGWDDMRGMLKAKWLLPVLLIALAVLTAVELPVAGSRQLGSAVPLAPVEGAGEAEPQPTTVAPVEAEPAREAGPAGRQTPEAKLDDTHCGTY